MNHKRIFLKFYIITFFLSALGCGFFGNDTDLKKKVSKDINSIKIETRLKEVQNNAKMILEELQPDIDFESFCGCQVFRKDGKIVFFKSAAPKSRGILKIKGKVFQMEQIIDKEYVERPPQSSDPFKFRFENENTSIVFSFSKPKTCIPAHPECESSTYSTESVLMLNKEKYIYRDLKTVCGC